MSAMSMRQLSGHSGQIAAATHRSRCNCVSVHAATNSNKGSQAAAAPAGSISRRELLWGASSAAAVVVSTSPLLLAAGPASAEDEAPFASVIDETPEPSTTAPESPAAPAAPATPAAQTPAADGLSSITTAEGEVRLRTYDQATSSMTPTDKQIFTLNRRVQAQNRVPDDFPGFIREGFDITIVGEGYKLDTNGLIYKDFAVGNGSSPVDGQQVVFDYTGYNESGTIIDSSYRKGRAAEVRLGINGLIPGFELGIKSMKPGGKRRIVVPPALGPPVGPSTFFSAKQCEVFDVELRQVKTCTRRQMAMFSDVVCE